MKVKDIIKLVEKDGWFVVRIKGSHRQFHHNSKNVQLQLQGNEV